MWQGHNSPFSSLGQLTPLKLDNTSLKSGKRDSDSVAGDTQNRLIIAVVASSFDSQTTALVL